MVSMESTTSVGELPEIGMPVRDLYIFLGAASLSLELGKAPLASGLDVISKAEHLRLASWHINEAIIAGGVPEELLQLPKTLFVNPSPELPTLTPLREAIEPTPPCEPGYAEFTKRPMRQINRTNRPPVQPRQRETTSSEARANEIEAQSEAIYDYVLNGGEKPKNLTRKTVRITLQKFARTEGITDKEVAGRYKILNGFLLGTSDPDHRIAQELVRKFDLSPQKSTKLDPLFDI